MKGHFIRLTKGCDLKEEIEKFVEVKNIKAGVVVSSVGCLDLAYLRCAGATKIKKLNGPLEIISLNGTVSVNRVHLHLSVSDKNLKVFGGHLVSGCLVDTTVELGIIEFSDLLFDKEFDINTNYHEIVFKNINK